MMIFACIFAVATLLVFAALHDVVTMTIPNWVSIVIFSLFLPTAYLMGMQWPEFGAHILVAGITLFVTITLFALKVFGGGDAKLIAATSVWAGPAAMLHFVYGIALFGGLLGITVLILRRFVPAEAAPDIVRMPLLKGKGVPYAVAIAAGAFWAASYSPVLQSALPSLIGQR